MIPNKEYIFDLLLKYNWSQNKFAQKAGVSKTTVSRWKNGLRGAGRELITGIIRAFPKEPLDKLFLMKWCNQKESMPSTEITEY